MENITLSYKISTEERMEGYDIYYRLKKRKFTVIKAALFAVALLLFIQQVYIDPYYTIGWICIIVCVGAIACILATPKLERRNYEHAVEALKDDSYRFDMSGDKITVSTVLPESDEQFLDVDKDGNSIKQPDIIPTVINKTEKGFKAYEAENVFAISSKEAFFTVPKSKLSVYEQESLRDGLKPQSIMINKK